MVKPGGALPSERKGLVRVVRVDSSRQRLIEDWVPLAELPSHPVLHKPPFIARFYDAYVSESLHKKSRSDSSGEPSVAVLLYNEPDPKHSRGLEEHGFVIDMRPTTEIETDPYDDEDFHARSPLGGGDALLVAFAPRPPELVQQHDVDVLGMPVDFPWSLPQVRRRLDWTAGVGHRLPEFVCMLSPRFEDPEHYEVQIRLENSYVLSTRYYHIYGDQIHEPVRHHSPQIVEVSLAGRDLQVVMGPVKSLRELVRVSIFVVGKARLPQVDAISLPAEKAAAWIKEALGRFFRAELLTKEIGSFARRFPPTAVPTTLATAIGREER